MKILVQVLITAIFISACGTKANDRNTLRKTEAVPVRIVDINSESKVSSIHVSGLITTQDEARLSFKIGGVIQSITVTEGARVKKGQLLATIIPSEIDAQVGQVALALEKAQRDYQRVSNLFKDSVATLEQFQNARTGVDIAKKNLQQVQFNQQYSRIYAPADGVIAKKILNEGEFASAGSAVIIVNSIGGSSRWILKAGVSDKDWTAISKGDAATVKLDAYPEKEFTAQVTNKSAASDLAGGSFQVELTINFAGQQPGIGMFGKAQIRPSTTVAGYTIPYDALLEANGRTGFVFVTNDKKSVKRVQVEIGELDDRFVYVLNGLEGYKHVVVSGSAYLNESSSITVSN